MIEVYQSERMDALDAEFEWMQWFTEESLATGSKFGPTLQMVKSFKVLPSDKQLEAIRRLENTLNDFLKTLSEKEDQKVKTELLTQGEDLTVLIRRWDRLSEEGRQTSEGQALLEKILRLVLENQEPYDRDFETIDFRKWASFIVNHHVEWSQVTETSKNEVSKNFRETLRSESIHTSLHVNHEFYLLKRDHPEFRLSFEEDPVDYNIVDAVQYDGQTYGVDV